MGQDAERPAQHAHHVLIRVDPSLTKVLVGLRARMQRAQRSMEASAQQVRLLQEAGRLSNLAPPPT